MSGISITAIRSVGTGRQFLILAGGTRPDLPSISVKVIYIDFDSSCQLKTHKREAFGSQAVAFIEVAVVPSNPFEGAPGVVGYSIQPTTKWYPSRRCCSVGVIVGGVDVSVVVEILLLVKVRFHAYHI